MALFRMLRRVLGEALPMVGLTLVLTAAIAQPVYGQDGQGGDGGDRSGGSAPEIVSGAVVGTLALVGGGFMLLKDRLRRRGS